MLNNDEGRRDYIAEEIKKRIIGPGMTSDAFVCADDYSDEILDNRPNVVYSAGMLLAPKKGDSSSETSTDDGFEIESANEQEEVSNVQRGDNNEDKDLTRVGKKDNSEDISDSERPDFAPDHIGLVMCLDKNVDKVNVDIKYGIYHHLASDEVEANVKVRLGRCALEQLKSTFAYYEKCSSVITNLRLFGCKSMADVFTIDEENLTISPKRIFSIKEEGKSNPTYMQATSFPRLRRNRVADVLLKVLREPGKEVELKILKKKEFEEELPELENIDCIKIFLTENKVQSLKDVFVYDDGDKCKVRTKKRTLATDMLNGLAEKLYVDDPVYDHILPLALQYNFFKREQKIIDTFSLDTLVKQYTPVSVPDTNDQLKLYWKVISNANGKKYLKVQLQNLSIKQDADKKVKDKTMPIEANVYQAELKISSDGIVPYTEPHRSSIDDEEYTLNEELYRDVKMYGKGVNCGIDWEGSNSDSNETPKWVRTTYAPQQRAAAFAADTEDKTTNDACVVYDMSIWTKRTKEDILQSLRHIAVAYSEWHKKQISEAGGNSALQTVLKDQDEFNKRLNDNVDYLKNNDRAYKCFLLANTAMYIQMCIARNPRFKKDRDISAYDSSDRIYKEGAWDFFKTRDANIKYRPFQLAFLLMNVKSTFENDDPYRNDNVDLIWFPTGGGKTEAYLALTALTIAERRTSGDADVSGVSVIMRYTLRLLTAQQFERASFLICALEFLRNELSQRAEYNLTLGGDKITLGMWIGSASTPNKLNELNGGKYARYFAAYDNGSKPESNPFPISYCPWCGCKLESAKKHGYDRKDGELHCLNTSNCSFNVLPIIYIDDTLYKNPPTLLFATVDKFAQLNDTEKGQMFGAGTDRRRPDLIIQDEMHLISGPLGSLVGMFETMVEEICTKKDENGNIVRRPKIIASTATTRNTLNLIKQLYARTVKTFPVSGVRYSDNFFSHVLHYSESKRLYMGLAPTGHSASELEIRSIAAEIVAKEKMISEYLSEKGVDIKDKEAVYNAISLNSHLIKNIDNYWSLVLYYMNLKSLGRTHSRIGQEILANAESMRAYLYEYPALNFVINGFQTRTEEFTSRQESSRIKSLLVEAESAPELVASPMHNISVKYNMDIVQATNMISVGIDIARWNVMFMVGQPLTTAEYIQSSSRVGRTTHGLVVNIYNSIRNRELSFYENYVPYHQEFYKFVEPLTATTFTPITLEKLIYNLYLCYMGAVLGHDRPSAITPNDIDDFKNIMIHRNAVITSNAVLRDFIDDKIDEIHEYFTDPARNNSTFSILLNEKDLNARVMNSLRDIESNTYIKYE